jgi:hypothetical protein
VCLTFFGGYKANRTKKLDILPHSTAKTESSHNPPTATAKNMTKKRTADYCNHSQQRYLEAQYFAGLFPVATVAE